MSGGGVLISTAYGDGRSRDCGVRQDEVAVCLVSESA